VNAGDLLGGRVLVADVDGDGLGDLVCAPVHGDGPISDGRGEERFGGGQIYVFLGRERQAIEGWLDLTNRADVTLYGAESGDGAGRQRLVAGDLDGDGYDDLVFGSGLDLLVFFGGQRATLKAVYDLAIDSMAVAIRPSVGSARIDGSLGDFDAVGHALAVADLNGDGLEDIIGTEVFNRGPETNRVSAGAVHVIFGRARSEFPPVFDVVNADEFPGADVTIFGADRTDHLGFEVATGDVDGDGLDDLLLSSFQGDGRENMSESAGEVYGYFGRRDWQSAYDIDTDEFDFAISGGGPAHFGYRLAVGDLDGDRRADLVVASELGLNSTNYGLVRIMFGRPRHAWPLWSDIDRDVDAAIVGFRQYVNEDDVFTVALSVNIGDHDGDGYEDLVIGAGVTDPPLAPRPEPRLGAGAVHLLRGRSRADWSVFVDVRVDPGDLVVYGAAGGSEGAGARGYDLLGFETAFGDIDGDGRADLFAAAPAADGPDDARPDCGEIYLFFGPDSVATSATSVPKVPALVQLLPNVPNPFNPLTTLHFTVPRGATTRLFVYDVRGAEVARLVDNEILDCEDCTRVWDAGGLSSGVYFIRLVAAGASSSRKVILVR
jgi:hypothetical protein